MEIVQQILLWLHRVSGFRFVCVIRIWDASSSASYCPPYPPYSGSVHEAISVQAEGNNIWLYGWFLRETQIWIVHWSVFYFGEKGVLSFQSPDSPSWFHVLYAHELNVRVFVISAILVYIIWWTDLYWISNGFISLAHVKVQCVVIGDISL